MLCFIAMFALTKAWQVNMQSDVGSLVDGLTRNLAAAWGSEMKSEDNKGY